MEEKTLAKEIVFEGRGLFDGKRAKVCLRPKERGGVVFSLNERKKLIEANLENVQKAIKTTELFHGGVSIKMVEHLLSALYGLGIDHAEIEVDGPEIPIFDGSAKYFVDLIERAGLISCKREREVVQLNDKVFFQEKESFYVALPADDFYITVISSHPKVALLNQSYTLCVNSDGYRENIAPCRTFALYEEIQPLIERGFLKDSGLENGIVIKDGVVLNKEGLRFKEEMVRHKILDLIGDISLSKKRFLAHIIAIRPSHFYNVLFTKKLINQLEGS